MAIERLDEDEKLTSTILMSGQNREVWLINEPGLYNLIFTSRKPEAKEFKKWVTHEVLPAIRKYGRYVPEASAPKPRMLTEMGRYPQLKVSARVRILEVSQRMANMEDSGIDGFQCYFNDICEALIDFEGQQSDMDILDLYVESCCVIDAGAVATSRDLYERFRRWYSTYAPNTTPPSHRKFGLMMGKRFQRQKTGGINHYTGVRLTPVFEIPEEEEMA